MNKNAFVFLNYQLTPLLFIYFIILCFAVFLPALWLCPMCMQWPQTPEEGNNFWEPELQMVLSHFVGVGNQTGVLWMRSQRV